jgi:DNA-binding XRE family transcriptional regulator
VRRQRPRGTTDDNPWLTSATRGCHSGRVSKYFEAPKHAELLVKLKEVRASALEHYRLAQDLSRQRRQLIDILIGEGFSQADLARELDVTRQAIQKMIAVGQDPPRR